MRRLSPRRGDGGAALVELAIVVPFLFTLLFAIIDYGSMYAQFLDVKSGAREGARLAIVDGETDSGNSTTNCANLVALIKARMPDTVQQSSIHVTVTYSDANGAIEPQVGDAVSMAVTYPRSSLSGLTSSLLGGTLTSTVTVRQEQTGNWVPSGQASCTG